MRIIFALFSSFYVLIILSYLSIFRLCAADEPRSNFSHLMDSYQYYDDDDLIDLSKDYLAKLNELSSKKYDKSPSFFQVYDDYVNQKFELVHKNDPKKFMEFRKVHQYHAIQNSFDSLKLKDVLMYDNFNAEDLDIISNKVNWTESEVTSYGFLGKQKEAPKYQFNKKDLVFHEPALADFFIAQYFYDNLVHPKDHPSDDEMELRIRFFLHVSFDQFNLKPQTDEFILGMIEDHNGEIYSDQVRMLMKYRFRYLLDGFYSNQLDFVDKASKMFSKDPEIIKNLWRIDDNQPYFLRFFRFLTNDDKVYKLKAIAEKFFTTEPNLTSNSTKPQAYNIFHGKNQILNVLSIIYLRVGDNFTKSILNVTKYQVSDETLAKLNQPLNFLDFVDQSNYSTIEKREFYLAKSHDMISSAGTGEILMKVWRRIQKYFSANELKGIITEKDKRFNMTKLFHLPIHRDQSFVEGFLSLTKRYLTIDEIKDFLVQRSPVSHESYMTQYIALVVDVTILKLNYNFAKDFLTHNELKDLIFNKNPAKLIKEISKNKEIFKFFMEIVSKFYKKDEILDMLIETDEYDSNFMFYITNWEFKYKRRDDVVDYLRDTFMDHQKKLRELLSARNKDGYTVFGMYKDTWREKVLMPFLELAKEVFSPEEILEFYKRH